MKRYYKIIAPGILVAATGAMLIEEWVGEKFLNGRLINSILVITLLFFSYAGFMKIAKTIGKLLN